MSRARRPFRSQPMRVDPEPPNRSTTISPLVLRRSALLLASLYASPNVAGMLLDHGAGLVDAPKEFKKAAAELEDTYMPLLHMVVRGQVENCGKRAADARTRR